MSDIYRIYKQEVSNRVRKDGMRLVKMYGCNGEEHRIQYFPLICDDDGGNVFNGMCSIRPDKVLGECDHKCGNLGFFTKYDG